MPFAAALQSNVQFWRGWCLGTRETVELTKTVSIKGSSVHSEASPLLYLNTEFTVLILTLNSFLQPETPWKEILLFYRRIRNKLSRFPPILCYNWQIRRCGAKLRLKNKPSIWPGNAVSNSDWREWVLSEKLLIFVLVSHPAFHIPGFRVSEAPSRGKS